MTIRITSPQTPTLSGQLDETADEIDGITIQFHKVTTTTDQGGNEIVTETLLGDTTTYSTGDFYFTPENLTAEPITIRARSLRYDSVSETDIFSDPTDFTFTFETVAIPTITEFGLVNDTGDITDDNITTDATLSGKLTGNDESYLGGITIEFDQGDGSEYGLATTNYDGSFSYDPVGLVAGTQTISARVTQWDYYTSAYVTGAWTPFTFEWTAPTNVAATIVDFILVNDTGDLPDDTLTTDGRLQGQIADTDGTLFDLKVEIREVGSTNAFTLYTDQQGYFSFNPQDLTNGLHTFEVRVQEWDYTTQQFVWGDWSQTSFTMESVENEKSNG